MSVTLLTAVLIRATASARDAPTAYTAGALWSVAHHHDNAANRHGQPPQKRTKLEADDGDGHDHDPSKLIHFARVSVPFQNDPQIEVVPQPAPRHLPHDLPVKLKNFEVLCPGTAALTFSPLTPASKKFDVTVEFDHDHGPDQVADLQRIFQLQRRSRSAESNSCVSAKCHLRYTQAATGLAEVELTCDVYWRDGSAVQNHQAGANPDRGFLSRYFSVPDVAREGQAIKPQDFYDVVHVPDQKAAVSPAVNESTLTTELYPFQKRAVSWMLKREKYRYKNQEPDVQSWNSSFRAARDYYGNQIFVSDLEGVVATRAYLEPRNNVNGGILCEEMGLGKTCELLSLICSNRRQSFETTSNLRATKATLIVMPNTILQQWKDEINRHAPHLRWTQYPGMTSVMNNKGKSGADKDKDMIESFQNLDIVLVTYTVLAGDIYFAVDPPDRSMRKRTVQRERRRSPLVQMDWWRVCLDEAQMVESGVSKAAQTAWLIPRRNAWAVSGTPVKKDVHDLRGLLIFLGIEPHARSDATWKRMVGNKEVFFEDFKNLFGRIALRHTKDVIRHELRLPPQRRIVVTMPFTTVEEQNYQDLFEQMADECGLTVDGAPASGLWDPDNPRTVEKMREWLTRLRQTCLHPQVGTRNKRALGGRGGPLRTVDEVLGLMIEQNESAINTEERMAITTLCLQGHIHANAKSLKHRAERALWFYKQAVARAQDLVRAAREELAKLPPPDSSAEKTQDGKDESSDSKKRGQLNTAVRHALELEHTCEFFIGSAYYQMKTAEGAEEGTARWQKLEKKEMEHYDRAKELRREILREPADRAKKAMAAVGVASKRPIAAPLPSTNLSDLDGGIETRRVLDKADGLCDMLERQTALLVEWRTQVATRLMKKLVDVDEDEVTGDEYENSTKHQDEMYAYFDAFRILAADRGNCITGEVNPLANEEAKTLYRTSQQHDDEDAAEGREIPPTRQLLRDLLDQRGALKRREGEGISLRGLTFEARNTEGTLLWNGADDPRLRAELALLRKATARLQSMTDAYTKVQTQLERDMELHRAAIRDRIEFYRQLQQLSDAVAPWREELDEELDRRELEGASSRLSQHEANLSTLRSKRRFLLHIRERSGEDEAEQRICVICQHDFEQGVLTVCGHQFCKECINLWWREHRNCPVCKRGLRTADFHNITYKPKDLKAREEAPLTAGGGGGAGNDDGTSSSSPSSSGTTPDQHGKVKIFDAMSTADLTAIRSVTLAGTRSFGTKIDTVARHLIHIRGSNPGSKTVIFSQYRDYLNVLSSALTAFGISHVSVTKSKSSLPSSSNSGGGGGGGGLGWDPITRFRTDPSVEAFLLDAKTDSSGLNLVVATNVMLCEPLVHPGVELQAIARVHRIGQTRPTNVFMYLVAGTVEEGIYDVSVRRRLELLHRFSSSSTSSASGPTSRGAQQQQQDQDQDQDQIDRVSRLELQRGGAEAWLAMGKGKSKGEGKGKASSASAGETVKQEDLWTCLFGGRSSSSSSSSSSVPRGSSRSFLDEDVDHFAASTTAAPDGRAAVVDNGGGGGGGGDAAAAAAAPGPSLRGQVRRFVTAEAAEARRHGLSDERG